jgi:hypothetical protein
MRPLETHEEKAAAMRARQAALKEVQGNKKRLEAAIRKAEKFTVEKALRRVKQDS